MKINTKFANESYECVRLKWDTEYFGVKSAKVILKKAISKPDLQAIIEMLFDYEFVAITNMNNNSANNYLLGQYINAFLVDVNIQFEKELAPPIDNFDANVVIGNNNLQANESIKQIAAKSFIYSRFFNDPFLDREKADKLYERWVDSSFNSEKKHFVYYKFGDNIPGFILYSYAPDTLEPVIELIAISDAYAGQGIGKKLIASLANYLFSTGYKHVTVGTQVDNLIAQNFYSACGFKHKQCNSTYHWWINKGELV